MLKPQDFEIEVVRELFNVINTHSKFPNSDIKEGVITLLKNLDDDLDAMDYGPSTGQNSVEESLEQLADAVSEYTDSLEEVDSDEDDDVEVDEDEPEPPTKPSV